METYYQNPRKMQIGNKGLEIKVRRLNHGVKRDLRNFFSNYALERETGMFEGIDIPAGAIESLVVRRGLDEMTFGGQIVQFNSPDPIDDFPDVGMGDEEDEVDLYIEVLKTIIDKNRFLARQYPYNMVFAQYLALVNAEKREYEQKQASETGGKVDTPVNREDEVGPNPTPSPQDMPTVQRISGSDIT